MDSDDLDLDLEPIKTPEKPISKPTPAAKADVPAGDAAVPKVPAADKASGAKSAAAKAPGVKALPVRRPSPVSKLTAAVAAPFQELRLPALTAKNAAWGLLALLVVVFLAANWSPVRVNVFHLWFVDIPQAVALIIDMAIGAGLLLLWQRMTAKKTDESAGAATPTGDK